MEEERKKQRVEKALESIQELEQKNIVKSLKIFWKHWNIYNEYIKQTENEDIQKSIDKIDILLGEDMIPKDEG